MNMGIGEERAQGASKVVQAARFVEEHGDQCPARKLKRKHIPAWTWLECYKEVAVDRSWAIPEEKQSD